MEKGENEMKTYSLYQLPTFKTNADVSSYFNVKLSYVKRGFTSDTINLKVQTLKGLYELHHNLTQLETSTYTKDSKVTTLLNHLKFHNPALLKSAEEILLYLNDPYKIINKFTEKTLNDIIEIELSIVDYVKLKGGEI